MRLKYFVLVGAACFVAVPLHVFAQDGSREDERARTHFDAGRQHYEEGAYDRALAEFQRAWELSQRPVLLINLATVEERLGMYREAADHLREYLRLAPDEPARVRLERRIANLERLARERAASGEEEARQQAEAPAASSATAEPAKGPDGGLFAGAIVGLGAGVAGGVVMATFGALALEQDAQLAAGCGVTGTCTDAEVADANTFALVSDVGLGALVAGAAVGTVLLVMALGSPADERSENALVVPWLSPDGGGVATRVRF